MLDAGGAAARDPSLRPKASRGRYKIFLGMAPGDSGLDRADRAARGGARSARGRVSELPHAAPVAGALSPRALDAALRLAHAEDATLVPVFLARVSLDLPLDTPLPRQSAIAVPLQEAIEQRATEFGVAVDARVERGRTYRHALRQTIATERFDRIVIAATTQDAAGFNADDVRWLLGNAPGEIVVLRTSNDEPLEPPAPQSRRRLARSGRTPTRVSS
jgi:hypothetical protein